MSKRIPVEVSVHARKRWAERATGDLNLALSRIRELNPHVGRLVASLDRPRVSSEGYPIHYVSDESERYIFVLADEGDQLVLLTVLTARQIVAMWEIQEGRKYESYLKGATA